MNKRRRRTQDSFILLINFILIFVLAIIFYYGWHLYYRNIVYFYQKGNWLLLAVFSVSFICFNQLYGGFKLGLSRMADLIFSQILSLIFANLIIYIIACFVDKSFISIIGFCYLLLVEIIVIVLFNILCNQIIYHLFPAKKTIIIYEDQSLNLQRKLSVYHKNVFDIQAVCSINEIDINKVFDEYECILIAQLSIEKRKYMLQKAYEQNISLFEIPSIYDVLMNSASITHIIDTPIFMVNNFGPNQISKILKRTFDIVFSLSMLIIASPIMLLVAFAIKLGDGGPAIYKQTRLTLHGKTFEVLKFRSMRIDAEKDGKAQLAKEKDTRITPVGNIIRMMRIDELPQLINILLGDMSVVGPRPERPEIVKENIDELPEFNYRLKVKAGLTGYAQIYGKYNTTLKDKLLLDLMYIENYSFFLDIKLVLMTVKIIFIKDSTEGV
ncbi:MAG: exopolysaccharide biosynthesis polyprenyl glycosylphosphotransferase [Erysipelotrichaceae bacterium]